MTKLEKFKKLEQTILGFYNKDYPEDQRVTSSDQFFKAYFVGALSVMIDEKTLDYFLKLYDDKEQEA